MFLFVFGLPGELTAWCESVALALMRHAGHAVNVLRADTLEDVAARALETGLSQAVVSSHQPGGRLRATVVESGRKFIFARDDPRSVLAELTLGRGVDLPAAVQRLASSCAALAGVAELPGALPVGDGGYPAGANETVAALASHLGIPIGTREIATLLQEIGDSDAAAPKYDVAEWWYGLADGERQLVSRALAPFVEGEGEEKSSSIGWSRELFFPGEQFSERINGPLDITGRARCLLHGPHVVVPPGSWSLSLTAAFLHGAVEHEFALEVSADGLLASSTIVPQHDGASEFVLGFTLAPETENPLAIRISSQRAAFDGAVALLAARLDPAPTPDDAEAT